MILTLITIDSVKQAHSFSEFRKQAELRYASYLAQEFTPYSESTWFTAVKPYHSTIFPFLVLDTLIRFRGTPCRFYFGHDLLPFRALSREELERDPNRKQELDEILSRPAKPKSQMVFHGFGSRIDIGLNALGTLYMDILDSLTRVEAEVLSCLRTLQYEKYQNPTRVKTFGLQKLVAEHLGKSPVAIHKSLRSSKFPLLAETATSMKQMMS